jgi:hypothetical protein
VRLGGALSSVDSGGREGGAGTGMLDSGGGRRRWAGVEAYDSSVGRTSRASGAGETPGRGSGRELDSRRDGDSERVGDSGRASSMLGVGGSTRRGDNGSAG